MQFFITNTPALFSVVVFSTTGGKFASELCCQEGRCKGMHWTSPAMGTEDEAANYARELAAKICG